MTTAARIVEPPSLKALVNTLAGAHLVVAADTGPAHIAAATGVPTVTLFGPKDPAVMAPLGRYTRAVRAGQHLAIVRDAFGREREVIEAPEDGYIITLAVEPLREPGALIVRLMSDIHMETAQ